MGRRRTGHSTATRILLRPARGTKRIPRSGHRPGPRRAPGRSRPALPADVPGRSAAFPTVCAAFSRPCAPTVCAGAHSGGAHDARSRARAAVQAERVLHSTHGALAPEPGGGFPVDMDTRQPTDTPRPSRGGSRPHPLSPPRRSRRPHRGSRNPRTSRLALAAAALLLAVLLTGGGAHGAVTAGTVGSADAAAHPVDWIAPVPSPVVVRGFDPPAAD